jgi:hypothetical protein
MLTRSTEGRLQELRRLCSLFADPTQQSGKQKFIPGRRRLPDRTGL